VPRLVAVKNHVAYVDLNQSEQALQEAWETIARDPEIYLAILTDAPIPVARGGAPEAESVSQTGEEVVAGPSAAISFGEMYKPVIAAVCGSCRGWQLRLAIAADIRVASPRAVFAFAGGDSAGLDSTVYLTRSVPGALPIELILTGRSIDGCDAYRLGIVSRIVPECQVVGAADEIAREILHNPHRAVWDMKDAVLRGRDVHLREAVRLGRQIEATHVYSTDAVRWRQEFARGVHRYTRDDARGTGTDHEPNRDPAE